MEIIQCYYSLRDEAGVLCNASLLVSMQPAKISPEEFRWCSNSRCNSYGFVTEVQHAARVAEGWKATMSRQPVLVKGFENRKETYERPVDGINRIVSCLYVR